MGNKLAKLSQKKAGKASKGTPTLIPEQQAADGFDENALEAELRVAQEAALSLLADVDLLADELRLEQQLAALDDEEVDEDGKPTAVAEEDGELDLEALDPDELAELEDELEELEAEMLGADDDDDAGGATAAEEGAPDATCGHTEVADSGAGREDDPAGTDDGQDAATASALTSPSPASDARARPTGQTVTHPSTDGTAAGAAARPGREPGPAAASTPAVAPPSGQAGLAAAEQGLEGTVGSEWAGAEVAAGEGLDDEPAAIAQMG